MGALETLHRAYKVDEAINKPGKLIIIRFEGEGKKEYREKEAKNSGKKKKKKEAKKPCPWVQPVDRWLEKEAIEPNSNDVEAYAVATKDVPELVARYKLFADITLIFFLNYVQVQRLDLNTIADADPYLGKYKATIDLLVIEMKITKEALAATGGNQSISAPLPSRGSNRVRRYYKRYGITNF